MDRNSPATSIGAHLAEDAWQAPLVAARPGLRVPGAWDGFELAVRAVLGQQITVKAAVRQAAELVDEYGGPLSVPNATIAGFTHVFPSPERLASAHLTRLKMPFKRVQALKTLAAAVTSDPHLFGPGTEPTECTKRLRAIAGIGEWTAQYIAIRELREPDAFPADDIGIRRVLADREGRPLTSREVSARAERWRPWRAYAAQHLWAAMADSRPKHR